MITCKTAWSICKGTLWWLSTLLTQCPSPDPGPLCIESHPCLQPRCLEWRQLQKPHRGPRHGPDEGGQAPVWRAAAGWRSAGTASWLLSDSATRRLPRRRWLAPPGKRRWDGERRVRGKEREPSVLELWQVALLHLLMYFILTDLWSGCYPGVILLYGWGSYFREHETSPKVTELVGGRVAMKGRIPNPGRFHISHSHIPTASYETCPSLGWFPNFSLHS